VKLLLTGPVTPYRGGIAAFNDALYSVLHLRHDVTVWNFRRMYPGFLFPGSSQFRPEAGAEENGVRLLDSIGFWSWPLLRAKLRREKFDAIIHPYWHPFFAPLWLSLHAKGTKRIVIGHNTMPHESFPFGNVLSRKLMKSADGLITLGRSELAQARELGFRGRGAWHPSPAYPAYIERFRTYAAPFSAPFESERPTILLFGMIRDYKGLDVLLSAMRLPVLSEVNLLIAGECYTGAEEVRTLIEPLKSRVYWYDKYLPDDDVPQLFAASDLVVLPYKKATSTGVLPLAYAAGLPVVVTNVGGLPDLVTEGETGAIVPPNNPEALANAIHQWLFNDEKRKEAISNHIPKMLQTMTFEALVDTMEREVL